MTDDFPVRPLDEETRELLEAIVAYIRRFVVLKPAQATVIALWVLHTHASPAADMTPYLAVTSAEKRSGKSTLLDLLAQLVHRPLPTANISDAALFRVISDETEDKPPTLLFDEVDAIFGPKAKDREDLRGMLNAGFSRGAVVRRCVGDGSKQKVEAFEVFSPKVLAGIGKLPDTITDRSLSIRLSRKLRTETTERARRRRITESGRPIRDRGERWSEQSIDALADAEPELPDELDDRAQDVAEPLLAIADLAGGEWSARARAAIVSLRGQAEPDEASLGTRLLTDIKTAFDKEEADKLSTEDLLAHLGDDEEAPWADWQGKGLTARALSRLLTPYGIRSRTVRLADGRTPKGYVRETFTDAWDRYIGPENATPPQPTLEAGLEDIPIRHTDPPVAANEDGASPHGERDVAGVADTGGNRENGTLEEQAERDLRQAIDASATADDVLDANGGRL